MLQAQPGQVFAWSDRKPVGAYSVLWHMPVAAERVPDVTNFWKRISGTESQERGFQFDTELKRLRGVRGGFPEVTAPLGKETPTCLLEMQSFFEVLWPQLSDLSCCVMVMSRRDKSPAILLETQGCVKRLRPSTV